MPYINKERRLQIQTFLDDTNTPGELNYAFTWLITAYLSPVTGPITYQKINDVLGALEGAKLELYRRVVVPYEDKKIQENGDVYT